MPSPMRRHLFLFLMAICAVSANVFFVKAVEAQGLFQTLRMRNSTQFKNNAVNSPVQRQNVVIRQNPVVPQKVVLQNQVQNRVIVQQSAPVQSVVPQQVRRTQVPVPQQAVMPTVRSMPADPVAVSPNPAPQTWLDRLTAICAAAKAGPILPTLDDLNRCKARLVQNSDVLTQILRQNPDREKAERLQKDWSLDELKKALADSNGPDEDVLQDAWNAFNKDPDVKWKVVEYIRNDLRRFRTFQSLLNRNEYDAQIARICDNLPKYIDEYAKSTDPAYGTALTDVMVWLDDVGAFEPNARAISALIRQRLSWCNVQIRAGINFVAIPFQQRQSEVQAVDENVMGTRIRGVTQMTGFSTARFVPNNRRAEIELLVNAAVTSRTYGSQNPVTVHTNTQGNLVGTKRIVITPDLIACAPAQSNANLRSAISNIQVNAAPILRCIIRHVAEGKVQERKPTAEAIMRGRAELRMRDRINAQVDPRIMQMNSNFHRQIRTPLLQSDFAPRVWNMQTTATTLDSNFLFGDTLHLAAPSPPPVLSRYADLLVHVHQSSLNNAAMKLLSGKEIKEDQAVGNVDPRFKRISEMLKKRDPDQPPIQFTLSPKGPVVVSFVNNQIKGTIRIDSFMQDETKYPGLDIVVLYNVKNMVERMPNGMNRALVVFEQAEAPQAFPRGFDPKGTSKLSAQQVAIRRIVMKRLEKTLPERIVAEQQQLPGEMAGRGVLVPTYARSQDGWLTMTWTWVPFR